MRKRVFRYMFFSAASSLLAVTSLVLLLLYGNFIKVSRQQLRDETALAARGVEQTGLSYFENLSEGSERITWVAADGTVLFDNQADPAAMENHLQREEIQKALQYGSGESSRRSKTLSVNEFYYALRLNDGSVLRLAVTQSSVWDLLLSVLWPVLGILLLALLISFLLASRLSRQIAEPLNRLDLDHPLENDCYDELSPLLGRISRQQEDIREQSELLKKQQNEFQTIVSSMQEGLILTDANGTVLGINPQACRLLHVDESCVGHDSLMASRSIPLQNLIHSALEGKAGECTVRLNGGIWQLMASPVQDGDKTAGTALIMIDVTEKEQAEQMRREFTANVSHELKTPIQSISGYAELIKAGVTREEDIRPFAGKIHHEAKRLAQLVEDIISLSHLDEGAADLKWEEMDLYAAARSAIGHLGEAAREHQVTLTLQGSSAPLYAIPRLMDPLVSNLIDNAIKYNRTGGTVNVAVENTSEHVRLSVSDTGIGIPQEDLSRIFERFYRVDKSHSRAIGGTGLGLSIVKHAAIIHHAKVNVQSVLGRGSTFTITFPKTHQEQNAEGEKS